METKVDKYLKIAAWLRKRYTDKDGNIVVYQNNKISNYKRLEKAFYFRYVMAK